MKNFILIMLISSMNMYASNSYSQQTKMSLELNSSDLKEVLREIRKQTEFSVLYRSSDVKEVQDIDGDFENATVMEILDKCLEGTDLGYDIQDKVIVIHPIEYVEPIVPNKEVQKKEPLTGKVTDSNGIPLPGVSVVVKGTTTGVSTDIDGNYNLTLNEENVTLVFSFVGMTPKEFTYTGQLVQDIVLIADSEQMEEIVVIGYGVQKKSDKTGAVSRISSEDIQEGPLQDPIEGIQGKIAGVSIQKSGSDPNGGFKVRIRGAAGLLTSASPLYIVDGVAGVDPTTVSSSDIESFNILKDASSCAIYGSRGANGVIIITTKKGKKGEARIEYDAYASIDALAKKLDMMSADEFIAFGEQSGNAVYNGGANTDWQDEIFRTGFSQNHNIAISGGNDKGVYRASYSYSKMDGILKGTDKTRNIVRINAQQKYFDDKLVLSANLSTTFEKNNYQSFGGAEVNSIIFQALQRNPTLPVKNDDGTYNQDNPSSINKLSNPVAAIDAITNKRDAKKILASARVDYEIISGLKFSTNLAYTRNDSEKFYSESPENVLFGSGMAKREYGNGYNFSGEAFVSYDKEINKIALKSVAGYTYHEEGSDGFKAQGKDLTSIYMGADNLGSLADVGSGDIGSWKSKNKLISFFGRAAVVYDSKYFLTATLRRDGSTKFGDNNEWGLFPSGSVAWDISKESFMQNTFVDQLKLRLGWGLTGNQEIGNYKDLVLYNITGREIDPETGKIRILYGPTQNPNPNLKWEVNEEYNLGLDFSIFRSRISGSVDVYSKITNDLLYNYKVPQPPYLVSSMTANGGEISVKGIEVFVMGTPVDAKDFRWETSVSFEHNKQIVESLDNDLFPSVGIQYEGSLGEPIGTRTQTQIMKDGEERGTFYGYKFSKWADKDGVKTMFYEAKDDDGNDVLKTATELSTEDKQIIGHSRPDFELGWTNKFKFLKNWDLSILIRSVVGHDIINSSQAVFGESSFFPGRNVLNSATENLGQSEAFIFSDYYLEKGTFVRLENITLGYTFPTKSLGLINSLRFYMSGNNLFTLTDYKGLDPSTNGIDHFNVYPKARSFSCGVKLSF